MRRESHVRFCEGGGVRFPSATRLAIMLWRNGEQVLEKVRGMLNRLGLLLHPEKTRVVTADEGFDFLGVHFRRRPVRKQNPRVKFSCRIWPSDRSVQRIKQKVKEKIGRRYGTSVEELIQDLNPVLRGWNNYHTTVQPERKQRCTWTRLKSQNNKMKVVRNHREIYLHRKSA